MRFKTAMASILAAALLAGCGGSGDNKGTAGKAGTPTPQLLPQPKGFTVALAGGKLSIDRKKLPSAEEIRVDYAPTSSKPTKVEIFNNELKMSEVSVKKGDRIHVLLTPLTPGRLVVKADGQRAVIKVGGPTG